MLQRAVVLLSSCGIVAGWGGWFLPGTAPNEYLEGQNVPVMVNVLSSVNTHLPYDYYSLPHCRPTKSMKGGAENLGEILLGDRIVPSPYEDVNINQNFKCKVVCPPRVLKKEDQQRFSELIEDGYHVNLLLDNLPVSTGSGAMGIPLGEKEVKSVYINNHLDLHIRYQAVQAWEGSGARRIVAFTARPYSIKHGVQEDGSVSTCGDAFNAENVPPQPAVTTDAIAFTYGVTFEESDEKYATRWDVYLNTGGGSSQIHWISVINNVVFGFFLSGVVAAIMIRTMLRDISRYNADADDACETGWKLVHADVFRPPARKGLLACHVGTGVQLLQMTFVILSLACLGAFSPKDRGVLFDAILLSFVFAGIFGGLWTARLMKMWEEPSWMVVLQTATLVPGVVFGAFFVLNLFVWHQGSSAAVPFSAIMGVVAIWFCISVPQVFLGAMIGYRKKALSNPTRTLQIARFIPVQPWYQQPWMMILAGGVLPFGTVFVELFFILTSIWTHKYYFVFGFLSLVWLQLCITCAEVAIVMCYYQLCSEDYHWWWRSFLTSGSSGLYVFLYSIFYLTNLMQMTKMVPILLFVGYMAIISYLFFVMTGTIGFLSCFWFVRRIFGSIKVD